MLLHRWPVAVTFLSVLFPACAMARGGITWRIIIGAPPPDPTYRESLENGQLGPPGYSEGYGYYPYMNLPGIVITNRPPPFVYHDPPASRTWASEVSVPGDVALFRVRVPADAEVWFSETKTMQQGIDRLFVTPSLGPAQSFAYEIRARWEENGREVERRQRVTVHAGDRQTVDFLPTRERLGKE
jgi:uncharacterized protein (TIGR03000 family)